MCHKIDIISTTSSDQLLGVNFKVLSNRNVEQAKMLVIW